MRILLLALLLLSLAACSGGSRGDLPVAVRDAGSAPRDGGIGTLRDGGPPRDAGPRDAGPVRDAGPDRDGGPPRDAGPRDGGPVRDGGSPRDAGPRDAGPRDAGPRDAGPRDAGPRDAGPRDAGPRDGGSAPVDAGAGDGGMLPDAGGCPIGVEGCACTSSFVATSTAYLQDDCGAGLLCVPWDIEAGQAQAVTAPVQSCVRPCLVDADCGAGRFCADSAFDDATLAGRFCVDQLAGSDEFCGGSRNTVSRLPGVTIETGAAMVGCAGGEVCLNTVLQHPDEGVCLQLCGRPNDPPCDPALPYCNPALLTQTGTQGSTIAVGVCSVAQLGAGSFCGSTLPGTAGLVAQCDTSVAAEDVRCVGVGLPNGEGICMELCTPASPTCAGTDGAPLGARTCRLGVFSTGEGICSSGCSNFGDDCTDAGGAGVGRFCVDLTTNVAICVDRRPPLLTPGELDALGNLVTLGGDCQLGGVDFARCPESTTCIGVGAQGSCLPGCSTTGPANFCTGVRAGLNQSTTNANCVSVFADPTIGICGAN